MSQPAGWATTATLYDETAEHQIRIQTGGAGLNWSCTCQPATGSGAGLTHRVPVDYFDAGTPIEDVLAAHAAHATGAVTVDAQRLGLTADQTHALTAAHLPRPPAR